MEAKADAKNTLLYNEILNQYKNKMQKSIDEVVNFYKPSDIADIHKNAKLKALSQVNESNDGKYFGM